MDQQCFSSWRTNPVRKVSDRRGGNSIEGDCILCPEEEIIWSPYSREGLCYISLPIPDRTPRIKNLSFFRALIQTIYAGYLVYIHCRGGHGRSGMFAGVLYGKIMQAIHAAHQLRTEMKPKFRKMGSRRLQLRGGS